MTTVTEAPAPPGGATRARPVGTPVDRVDGREKTTGAARYSAEYPYPDLAHAALVPATVARGRITRIDTAEAAAVTGVLAVLTHLNAPKLKPVRRVTPLDLSSAVSGTPVDYLDTDEVHWDGQPVAVVVAETLEAARHAARLVRVGYEAAPATVDFAAELDNAEPDKGNPLQPGRAVKGDAPAALAAAAVSVDLRFRTPPYNHNALEPHSTTAVWDGDRLTVHEGTQNIGWLRKHLANRFGVPADAVRVVSTYVGGAFGGKFRVWAGTLLAALSARAVGRPVRLMLSREEVYRTVGGRTPSVQRVALGARPDGTLTAIVHTAVTRTGRSGGDNEPVTGVSRHQYACDNILAEQKRVKLDVLPNTTMRAPGESIGTFALESAVDELAVRLGLDPIELRLRNEPDVGPMDGRKHSHRRVREAYAVGAERFGWAGRDPRPGSTRDGRWLVGMGVATAYHPALMMGAQVTVRLSAGGSVLVRCGFHEFGNGASTAQTQIAAQALGVPVEAVTVEYGSSDQPVGPLGGGSMQTASVAADLLAACEKVKREVLGLAGRSPDSPLRGCAPGDVVARDGGLFRADRPGAGETYPAILGRAGRDEVAAAVGTGSRLAGVAGQVRSFGRALRGLRGPGRAATGAQFCEVRVDSDTGEVRVSRWTGVFDIGTVVNPKLAGSQLRGGIVMGLGMALGEETLVDPRSGRIMNPSLSEYHIPVHADVPRIDVHVLDDPDPTMPLGVVGAGEVGITGVAAAIANAVRHATGRRLTELPITLDRLL
ncbi:xanthine dehydrogenase family protein molybdopterin-binding subunit [Nonomuraea sp. NPDC047897]|uniref:xanthine dehydrogenase family protein molybdopterin-binding subunit n=1 Tax=Nonomuraea sp. NPDC047897 TaxID=3364346 RepID=UPI00371DC658